MKYPWESKTIIANVIMAAAPFYPPLNAYLAGHPMMLTEVLCAVNLVLRLVTHEKISLSE